VNQATAITPHTEKNPLLAAAGSFFFPGLGQVYNGESIVKGLLFFVGTLIGYIIFILPGLAIWVYSIYNAYKVAKDMNAGLVPYKETTTANLAIFAVISLVIYGLYFIGIIILSAVIAAFIFGISSSTTYYGY
jgi:TM2 domain-containing membrane protein YozV